MALFDLQRSVGEHASVYVGPHLRLFSAPFGKTEDYVGYGAELGVRWFPVGGAPEGWWVLGRNVAAHLRRGTPTGTVTDVGGYTSVLGGYTAIFGDWFVLSEGAGVQYLWYEIDGLGTTGPAPALHTMIGVAF